jgi:mannosyl-oligosaccharide alpha-1,2-mannosidase
MNVFKHLDSLDKDQGLYPLYVNIRSGQFHGSEYSLGALGDSFYEYMVKLWLFTSKQADGYRRMYEESSVGILNKLVQTTPSGYRYMAQIGKGNRLEKKMEHLACFSGGMFALAAANEATPNHQTHLDLGADITRTCYKSYNSTATGIGPEVFEFHTNDFVAAPRAKYYILRPETVESYFVLWRTTKDPIYREYAWEAFTNIRKHCKVDGGYSGIHDVNSLPVAHDDTQQSFFLAETLKYLYLIFSDDSVIPLDKYVFNTEAHPLGIVTASLADWDPELRSFLIEE